MVDMKLKIIWVLALIIIAAVVAWAFRPNSTLAPANGNGEGVYCTADAMQCPDGTWVGRTGPNCEFVCPN
jgi:hypothetical protein